MNGKIFIIGILSLTLSFLSVLSFSQSHFPGNYAVYFADKDNSGYSLNKPQEFLSLKSISRREKQNIAIDSSDIPVSRPYITQLAGFGKIKYTSRWQNSALVIFNDSVSFVNAKK